MKILQICPSIAEMAQGPAYTIPSLCKALAGSGHEVTLMSIDLAVTEPQSNAEVMGKETLRPDCGIYLDQRFPKTGHGLPIFDRLWSSATLKAAIRRSVPNYDIFHTQGIWLLSNTYASTALKSAEPKLVLSPRGMMAPRALKYSGFIKKIFWRLFQEKALRRVDMFHATSEQECADIRALNLTQPVVIIPNGIDLPDVTDESKASTATPKTVLFLARIHPIKRIDTLLEAWAQLQDRFPDWQLKIVGPGPDDVVNNLKSMAHNLNTKRVIFEGAVFGEAKTQAYKDASLYVLPSDSENFAMTVAESLAAEVPVITTKGTPWSQLKDYRCGWWIDHGTTSLEVALSEAMSLTDSERKDMGARGREWMSEAFSWEGIAQQMTQAYDWLAKGGAESGADKPDCIRL